MEPSDLIPWRDGSQNPDLAVPLGAELLTGVGVLGQQQREPSVHHCTLWTVPGGDLGAHIVVAAEQGAGPEDSKPQSGDQAGDLVGGNQCCTKTVTVGMEPG